MHKVVEQAGRLVRKYGWHASWVVLGLAAAYVAVELSQARAVVGDQTNISYMLHGWHFDGSLNFMAQHTNLMKLPLLWLQANLFPYNLASLTVMNVLMVVATVVGWSWLLGRVIRNRTVIMAVNLALAGLLLGSTELATDLTMATIRNIEYPLLLVYLLGLRSLLVRRSWRTWGLAGGLLALLVASDYFFAYSVPLAIVAAVVILAGARRISWRLAGYVGGNAIVATLAGLVLLKALKAVHLLILYESPRPLISYDHFWPAVSATIFQIFKMFGGDFFGMAVRVNSLARIGLAAFTVLSAYAIYRVVKAHNARLTLKPAAVARQGQDEAFLVYALLFVVVLTIGAYILSAFATPTGENNRYLSILPFMAVTFAALWLRNVRAVFLLAGALLVLFLGLLTAPENHRGYLYVKDTYQSTVQLDKDISAYMHDYGVTRGYGSLGYTSPVWLFSDGKTEIYNIQPCNVGNPILSTSRWYKHYPNEPTALIIDRLPDRSASSETWLDCSDQHLEDLYGTPKARETITVHNGKPVEVWLYDYNIGTRLQKP